MLTAENLETQLPSYPGTECAVGGWEGVVGVHGSIPRELLEGSLSEEL